MTDSKKANVYTVSSALSEYGVGQWWVAELLAHAGVGKCNNDTRRAAKVAVDFVNLATQEPDEYIYRFRHFESPQYQHPAHAGWKDWEFCDKSKYEEILTYIGMGNTYQAQRIPVRADQNTSFSFEQKGFVEPLYRVCDEDTKKEMQITREELAPMRKASLRDGTWKSFYISHDRGETWVRL